MKIRLQNFSIFLFLIAGISSAEVIGGDLPTSVYHWRPFTRFDGLIGNDVRAISQDQSGRIWIGTSTGLNIFDGMWVGISSIDGLISDQINAVDQTPDGTIWVGTSSGISSFDGIRWTKIQLHDDPLGNYILMSYVEPDRIWFGSYLGVWTFDGNEWIDWTTRNSDLRHGVSSMIRDSSGAIWFGMEPSAQFSTLLLMFDGEEWFRFTSESGLPNGQVLGIVEDKEGIIWAATPNGLARFNGSSWTTYQFETAVVDLDLDSDGSIWVLTRERLLNHGANGWTEMELPSIASRPQTLFRDSQNGIWIGTAGSGLIYADRKAQMFRDVGTLSVVQDRSGRIWFGDGDQISLKSDPSIAVRVNTLRSLDIHGDHLLASTQDGLWMIDPETLEVKNVTPDVEYPDIRFAYTDSAGNLWIGSGIFVSGPGGIASRFSELVKRTSSGDEKKITLPATPSAIAEDGMGAIWVGTYGAGLVRISAGEVRWQTTTDGLPGNLVTSVLATQGQEIWVGTSEGAAVLRDGRWITFTAFDRSLLDNRVQALAEDNLGRIWVGTQEGISIIQNGVSSTFTMEDGLPSDRVNRIFVDSSGTVWISTSQGALSYLRETREPQTAIIAGPRGVIGTSSAFFEFTGGDIDTPTDELLFSWRLNDGAWSIPSSKRFAGLSNLKNKQTHLFQVRAHDKNGNVDTTPASVSIYVNESSPTVDILKPVRGSFTGGRIDIIGTVSDDDLFRYSLFVDGEEFHSADSPVKGDLLGELDTTLLADGVHELSVVAIDKLDGDFDTQHESRASVDFNVDNTPPELNILTPIPGGDYQGEITISFEVHDVNPDRYEIKYRQSPDGNYINLTSGDVIDSQKFDINWNSSAMYGDVVIEISVSDKAQNITSREVGIFLKNDSARPTLSLSVPADGQVISGISQIRGSAADPTLSRYTLQYRSIETTNWTTLDEGSSGSFNLRTIALWDTTLLPDGDYLLRFSAIDDNGYSSEIIHHIEIDNTPPIVKITAPTSGRIIPDSPDLAILGTCWDKNLQSYTVSYRENNPDSEEIVIAVSQTPIEDGQLALWNVSRISGAVEMRVSATDKAGNSASASVQFEVDPDLPIVEISSPLKGEVLSGKVRIDGLVKDPNLASFVLSAEDLNSGAEEVISEGDQPLDGTIGVWDTSGRNGEYLLHLEARDLAGNSAEIQPIRVTIDNLPPQIDLTSPLPGSQVTGEVSIFGRITDLTEVKYVVEFNDPSAPEVWKRIFEGTIADSDLRALAIWNSSGRTGEHRIKVQATDGAGFESAAIIRVIVPEMITRSAGGVSRSSTGDIRLIIPPGSLVQDSAQIAINRISGLIVRVTPSDLSFRHDKPAILVVPLPTNLSDNRVCIERWSNSEGMWRQIGGGIDRSNSTIAVAVVSGGDYRITDSPTGETVDEIPSGDLLCHPRALIRGDPIYGRIWLSFKVQPQESIWLGIFDMSGKLQRVLMSEKSGNERSITIPWDGTDREGNLLASGPYFAQLVIGKSSTRKGIIIWNR